MAKKYLQSVIDIHPWPQGLGFKDAALWWEYIRSRTEQEKLEALMLLALLSEEVCQQLLNHDLSLFDAFQFSTETIALLSSIHANTLTAFAAALVNKNYTFDEGNIP